MISIHLPTSARARWWLLAAALVMLALASSGIGIGNGFTYDDVYVIQRNGAVHSLHRWWRLFAQSYWPRSWGADGYRPVTMLGFAVEWVVGGGSPWVFHAVNVALYCATTVAMFWLASAILPLTAAWIASALFAVHPVHVEAVASTVGQSELSVALLLTLAVGLFVRRRASAPPGASLSMGAMAAIAVCYTIAMFAKEHAIVLPALLLAAEATVVVDPRPLRTRLVLLRPFLLVLTLIAVAYLGARAAVKGGEISGFQPFIVFQSLDLSYVNRVLTMIGVVPQWVRLLLWPARLSTEYAPPYVDVAQAPALTQLPGLLILVGVFGLAAVLWRRRGVGSAASFGIAWFCIALLPSSNFIIPAGIILAERTLFLPSLGAMLALGAATPWIARRFATLRSNDAARVSRILVPITVGTILLAGAWRSITRTRVWQSNERLFAQAIVDAPESYRAHYMLGAWFFETGRKKEGEHHYRRALQLFPYDPFMSYNLAQQYQSAGMFLAAIPLYRWAFEINPQFHEGQGRANLALCLIDAREPAQAREQALIAIRFGGAPLKQLRNIMQMADSALRASKTHAQSNRLNTAVVLPDWHAGKVRENVQITGEWSETPVGSRAARP